MNVVLGAALFAVFAAVPSMTLSAMILLTQSPRRPDAFDDFLVVAYVAGVSSGISAIGFLIPTAISQPFRKISKLKAAQISGILGLISPVAYFVVIAIGAIGLNMLFRSPYYLVALAIGQGLPGLALGIFAHYSARYFVHWDRKVERSGQ